MRGVSEMADIAGESNGYTRPRRQTRNNVTSQFGARSLAGPHRHRSYRGAHESEAAHSLVAVVGVADGRRGPQYHHDGSDRRRTRSRRGRIRAEACSRGRHRRRAGDHRPVRLREVDADQCRRREGRAARRRGPARRPEAGARAGHLLRLQRAAHRPGRARPPRFTPSSWPKPTPSTPARSGRMPASPTGSRVWSAPLATAATRWMRWPATMALPPAPLTSCSRPRQGRLSRGPAEHPRPGLAASRVDRGRRQRQVCRARRSTANTCVSSRASMAHHRAQGARGVPELITDLVLESEYLGG